LQRSSTSPRLAPDDVIARPNARSARLRCAL